MKRIVRDRRLTPEEAAKLKLIREQVAADLPDLVAQFHEQKSARAAKAQGWSIPSVSMTYARDGSSRSRTRWACGRCRNESGRNGASSTCCSNLRPRREKSRTDVCRSRQTVPPEAQAGDHRRSGAEHRRSFHDEPLSKLGFFADWHVAPKWNLCDAPGGDNNGKVDAVRKFLDSDDKAWSARMPLSALRWTGLAPRRSTTG